VKEKGERMKDEIIVIYVPYFEREEK